MAVDSRARHGLLILAAVSLTYLTENFLRAAPSALSPILIEELDLSYGFAGLLLSSYFFLYALMQLPSGILSDALGPRRTIMGFTVFTVVGALLFYVSHRFELLMVAQLLIGLGSSVFYINAVKVVSSWFPAERRASAIGVLSAASGLGSFAAYMGFPLASVYFGGWRALYVYCIVLMIANFFVNVFIIKDRPNGEGSTRAEGSAVLGSLGTALRNRRLYPFIAGYILLCANWAFFTWLPQFLTDAKGLSYIDVGLVSSAGTIMGIPGCIAMGVISDRLRKRKLPLVAFSAVTNVFLVAVLLSPAGTPMTVFAALMAAMGFSMSLWVLFFSMIPETLPPEIAGIGLGLVNGAGSLGFSVVTSIYGALVDVTGSYLASNVGILVANILMTLNFFFLMKETYGGDRATE